MFMAVNALNYVAPLVLSVSAPFKLKSSLLTSSLAWCLELYSA